MAATHVPQLNYAEQIVDPATGRLTPYAFAVLSALIERSGGVSDKVDAAHVLATNAVPQGTQVVAAGGLKLGGPLGGNVGVALYSLIDVLANLPGGGLAEGDWAFAADGRKPGEGAGAGTGVPAFWSAGAWVSACDGAAVTV